MTKEELITKIKKLGDMSLNDQISSYDVYYWLKDIRDNGIEEPKKYRIRLEGFNSDNGQQYLTAGRSGENRLFACALKPGLKQEFTSDEINEIINQLDFKGTWRTDMVRAGLEPVEDE